MKRSETAKRKTKSVAKADKTESDPKKGQLFILEMKVSQTLQWTWEWKADPLPWKLLIWEQPCPLFPTRQMPKFCHSPEVAYWKLYQTLLQCEFGSSIFSIWSTSLIGSFTVCSTGHCTSSSLLCVFLIYPISTWEHPMTITTDEIISAKEAIVASDALKHKFYGETQVPLSTHVP